MQAKCEVCGSTFDDSYQGYTVSVDRRSKTGLSMGHSYCSKEHAAQGLDKLQ